MSASKIDALMRDQHGVASRQQLCDLDMSEAMIRHRLRQGVWIREYPGIYRHSMVVRSWRSDAVMATLGAKGVASHGTAGRLHRLPELPHVGGTEVTVAHGRSKKVPRTRVYQSTQIDRLDVVTIDEISCTGLERTVLDLGARVSPQRLGAIVDAMVRSDRTTLASLWDVLVRHSRRGRDGCGNLRAVLEERTTADAIPLSEWSRMVARLVVAAGLPQPVLEHQIHGRQGRFIAQVDLAYPDAKLAIELDSVAFHLNVESFKRDRRRLRALTVAGWTVLPFTWEDYHERPNELIRQLRSFLKPPAVAV